MTRTLARTSPDTLDVAIGAAIRLRRKQLKISNAMTHQVAEYRAAGMDEVVTKPVELTTLLGAMEQALSLGDADMSERPSVAA